MSDMKSFEYLEFNDLRKKEEEILEASKNANTNRAMESAVRHFTEVYGGKLPCSSEELKDYLVTYAGHLSLSTLEQRRVLIARWHKENGLIHNPNDSEVIRSIMRGIRASYPSAVKQAKPTPISVLTKVCEYTDEMLSLGDMHMLRLLRDRAMILTAFWFGLRSDELINIRVRDVTFNWDYEPPYMEIFIPRSKTDKEARGTKKHIQKLPALCPMAAMDQWLEARKMGKSVLTKDEISEPAFSKISRYGRISVSPIHSNSVNKLFRRILSDAGIDAQDYSSHSMRRGVANWVIDSGASVVELKEWIGWKDTRSAMRYLDGKNSLPNRLIERSLSNTVPADKLSSIEKK